MYWVSMVGGIFWAVDMVVAPVYRAPDMYFRGFYHRSRVSEVSDWAHDVLAEFAIALRKAERHFAALMVSWLRRLRKAFPEGGNPPCYTDPFIVRYAPRARSPRHGAYLRHFYKDCA